MSLKERLKSDSGLMGPTHALSAVALTFFIAWITPNFMFEALLGSYDKYVFISALIVIVGSALMPDLDAVQSTSINTLGPIGKILSTLMRGFSSIVQSTIRARGDSPDQDPHRGFWHTILSGFLVGFLVFSLTKMNVEFFTIGDKVITFATFVVAFIIYISMQLLMASLFKNIYKKTKNSLTGMLSVKFGSIIVTVLLITLMPKDLSYDWVGAAVAFGWILHLLGDAMTVSGVPLLFPLKIKGKRWWNHRLPFAIKAGGFIEMSVIVPIFLLMAAVSMIAVIPMLN